MLSYFRKWAIELKRRRLKKERALLKRYISIEEGTREDGNQCHNCRAPLTGPYCHICGQRDDDLRRPIWTFFREFFDAIFDTDSKIIKTILLLVLLPGGLSRAFMEGRRARFLPPFRLYVVLLFVFFSTLSIADVLILDIHVQPKAERVAAREAADEARRQAVEQAEQQRKEQERVLEEVRESTVKLEKQLLEDGLVKPGDITSKATLPTPEATFNSAPVVPETPSLLDAVEGIGKNDNKGAETLKGLLGRIALQAAAQGDSNEAEPLIRKAQERAREILSDPTKRLGPGEREALQSVLEIDAGLIEEQIAAAQSNNGDGNFISGSDDWPYDFDLAMFVKNEDEERAGIKQEDIDDILDDPGVPPLVKKATEGFAAALQKPREFNEVFNDNLPWAMVILLPVFAFIMRIFHWGKRRYYLNQLVFALHFHSFLFVMLTAFAFIVPAIGGENAAGVFWWGTSLYLIIALKVGQDQGWFRAFFKAGFIWVSYFFIMMFTMTIVMFVGLSDSSVRELWDFIQDPEAGTIERLDDRALPEAQNLPNEEHNADDLPDDDPAGKPADAAPPRPSGR